jgi:hypothetical protein
MNQVQCLDKEYYRCRICQKKCHREINSYEMKITEKTSLFVCRHCWRHINIYLTLVQKIKDQEKEVGT